VKGHLFEPNDGHQGTEAFIGSVRAATAADCTRLPCVAVTPNGKERPFTTPSAAWRWLRSLRRKADRPDSPARVDFAPGAFDQPIQIDFAPGAFDQPIRLPCREVS